MPKWFSTFLCHRIRSRRKRFIQLWVRSTTRRRAFSPASRFNALAYSPRARTCAVKPNSFTNSLVSPWSYPWPRHIPRGLSGVGSGRSAGVSARSDWP